MNLVIYPYNLGSASARALKEALTDRLQARVLRVRSSARLRQRPRIVLNLGNARPPEFFHTRMINQPAAVNVAGNKLLSFQALRDANIPIPEFTTDIAQASNWLQEGISVLSREALRGHSGEGIVINNPNPTNAVALAPLYVKYKKKKHEFRVHVFNGQVIDLQQKKKIRDFEHTDEQKKVRSHHNGWVFCREDLNLNEENLVRIKAIAVSAVNVLGLDFGAVDIIFNERENAFYVLEVNTAPGLEGQTLESYVEAIANFVGV